VQQEALTFKSAGRALVLKPLFSLLSYTSTNVRINAGKTAHVVKMSQRKHKCKRKAKHFFFHSLYTCALACVEITHTDTERSTSTCLSNVWPNQPRTQRFSPFFPLSSEGKERDPGYETVAKSLIIQIQWSKNCISFMHVLFNLIL